MPEQAIVSGAKDAQFERAILWASHPDLLWQHAGGLSVLERQLFTAARSGLKSVWISLRKPGTAVLKNLRTPPNLTIYWIGDAADPLPECTPPYLGLSCDHFIRVKTLAHIARQNDLKSTSFNDASGLGVVQVVPTHDETTQRANLPLPENAYHRLKMPANDDGAISWLMDAGPKSQDGFMARHFDRHLSLAVSKRLLETPITPNAMTIFSTLLGLIGAAFFLGSSRATYVPGALIVWMHSVLDGCDGELARVRFQESSFGSDLDFWGDNVVHVALFSCLGYGFWRTGNGTHTLFLAAAADLGVIASALVAWQYRRLQRAASSVPIAEAEVTEESFGNGFRSKLSHLENVLAQRDFIYLLVFLAFVDCVYEFLWAAAIGSLLYFGTMLYLRRVKEYDKAF